MLQHKDTHKLSELKNSFTHSWVEADFIFKTLKCFSFSQLNKSLSIFKVKGYKFDLVMSILISLPFINVSTVNQLSGIIAPQKDVFYRLKNNTAICWRFILWLFAVKFCKLTHNQQAEKSTKCLIFDDTTIAKSGKCIEGVSRVWDHVQNRSILGFKLLLMGLWDSTSFLPLDFSLHREAGKNKAKSYGLSAKQIKKQKKVKRKHGTHAYDRVKEADQDKITSMIKMLKRAVAHKIDFEYVLTDSWFTCEALIEQVYQIKQRCVKLIGMYSKVKTKFDFRGKSLTYKQIRNYLGKPKRCRSLKLYYLQAHVNYNGHAIQLFFCKQGQNGKWKVILTTDNSISFIQLIELYQTRWTIEVFYKESKQLLGLGKCQSETFDAQIADLTITMIQHILLTFRHRYDTYETKGALFEQIRQDTALLRLNERIWGLFVELINIITELFDDIDTEALLIKMINNENAMKKISLLLNADFDEKNVA